MKRRSHKEKQVELLTSAVLALRDRDRDAFGRAIEDSYRLDVATGEGWRDRLPLPRTMRVALLRAQSEHIVSDALEAV